MQAVDLKSIFRRKFKTWRGVGGRVSREVWELGVRRGKSRRSRGSYEGVMKGREN